MKRKLLSLLLALGFIFTCFTGCDQLANLFQSSSEPEIVKIDYVDQVKLDMNSETQKMKVTVKIYIDGDTTHFYVPRSFNQDGVLKARYLAVNTPNPPALLKNGVKRLPITRKQPLKVQPLLSLKRTVLRGKRIPLWSVTSFGFGIKPIQ